VTSLVDPARVNTDVQHREGQRSIEVPDGAALANSTDFGKEKRSLRSSVNSKKEHLPKSILKQ